VYNGMCHSNEHLDVFGGTTAELRV
jgi:hypothetical protein